MNEKLTTYLRHAITSLPAVFAGFAANGFLTAEEAAKLDGDLKVFLIGLAAVLAGATTRWVMKVVAKHAPHLSNIFGGGSSGGSLPLLAMTAAAWAAISMAGGLLMSSCVVGGDSKGGWYVKPDPMTVTEGLKYLVRQDEDSAKAGLVQWSYYDPETGKEIPKEDYAAWGITASPAE